jgi:predicted transposase YdaD
MQDSVIYRSIQEEAETRAEVRKQREIATNLLQDGLPIETVARGTGLSVEEVQQIQQHMNESGQN